MSTGTRSIDRYSIDMFKPASFKGFHGCNWLLLHSPKQGDWRIATTNSSECPSAWVWCACLMSWCSPNTGMFHTMLRAFSTVLSEQRVFSMLIEWPSSGLKWTHPSDFVEMHSHLVCDTVRIGGRDDHGCNSAIIDIVHWHRQLRRRCPHSISFSLNGFEWDVCNWRTGLSRTVWGIIVWLIDVLSLSLMSIHSDHLPACCVRKALWRDVG